MTWEELNRKHDYDTPGLIHFMPENIKKMISDAWGGGMLHPYNAAEKVLGKVDVDLDEVDRLYSEKSSKSVAHDTDSNEA